MEDDIFTDGNVAPKPKPAPVKKSLFTKRAIARAAETDDSVAFFSRSRELWPQQLEEQERRRKKKEIKHERKRTSESEEAKDAASPQEGKRRRVSGKQDAIALDSDDDVAIVSEVADRTRGDTSHSTPGKRKSRRTSHTSQASPNSLSERYSRDLRAQKRNGPVKVNKGYISLSEDDDDDLAVRKLSEEPIVLDDGEDVYIEEVRPRQPPPRKNDDNDLSDEEFPELVAMARERERQKSLAKEKASKATAASDDIFELEPAIVDDPTIEIFITSEIEETKSLLVRRKLSQQLRQVRQIWCDKQSIQGQPMSRDVKDAIFLTWKGKRLFDYTTCSALGLKVNASGRLDGDGVDESGRVHLEAWTEELYDQHQKMLAAKEHKATMAGEYDDEEAEEQPKEVKLRLIFKSKDYGEFKLQAKPTTIVQKMIEAFRKARQVPQDKYISFHVDGDKLEEDTQLADTELEDMDAVEVHIR
ncbi:ubiquitin-2 like Rad60 SUMO-like-domain-containing protein [Halenospora varia]|nr:ubiquitin-2 like Rad60 SUMO-like-domain-containing protein [Halenospora varia]